MSDWYKEKGLDNPKSGIMWDAHDAVIARHHRLEEKMSNADFANPDGYVHPEDKLVRRIWTFGGLLIIGVILLIGFLLLKPEPVELTDTNQMQLNGETYQCNHYSDGTMECWDVTDPDIGFGKIGG